MPPNSQSAFDELRNFQGSRRKAADILKESESRLGLPDATKRQQGLRTAITNTENLIKAVEPSVSGRTGGSLVTEAQKTRLVGLERQPLDTAFSEQNRALEGESAIASELQRRALQESQLQLSEDDARQNALQGVYSTLYQREQDAIAKAERDRAFEEQKRLVAEEQKRLAAQTNLFNPGSSSGSTSTPAITDPTKQSAYNEVYDRMNNSTNEQLLSDFQATQRSANLGNARDKAKIQFYLTFNPNLFRYAVIPGNTKPASQVLSNKVSF